MFKKIFTFIVEYIFPILWPGLLIIFMIILIIFMIRYNYSIEFIFKWPTVFLIFIFMFFKPINELLKKLKSFKFGKNFELSFEDALKIIEGTEMMEANNILLSMEETHKKNIKGTRELINDEDEDLIYKIAKILNTMETPEVEKATEIVKDSDEILKKVQTKDFENIIDEDDEEKIKNIVKNTIKKTIK